MLKESRVRGYAARQLRKSERVIKEARERTTDVFLSHSSHDADLVADVVAFLEDQGLEVYVDRADPHMPKITSEETASRLKDQIRDCKKVMLMATNNAVKRSRWVPWELGLADGMKGPSGVILLPLVEDDGTWEGAEYLQRYPSVHSTSKGGFAVFEPGQSKGGKLLKGL